MKSYCVKQKKKQTECVSGTERIVQTRNGRAMMKCKCSECGITKTKFVKSGSTTAEGRKGKGLLLGKNSPFKGIPLIGAIL